VIRALIRLAWFVVGVLGVAAVIAYHDTLGMPFHLSEPGIIAMGPLWYEARRIALPLVSGVLASVFARAFFVLLASAVYLARGRRPAFAPGPR